LGALPSAVPCARLHARQVLWEWSLTDLAESVFGIITRQAIRRGTFTSVKDLIIAIETYIDGWNDRCQPFTWTKTADDILTKATSGQRTSFTRH
jgi:hypothetical protein